MTAATAPPGVVIENLRLGFDKPDVVTILDGVSFTVEPHERVALVGPSGCGKTTVLSCIAGLHAPHGGQVLVNGVDPYTSTAARRRELLARTIGYIPQHVHLVRHATALDNILIGGITATRSAKRDRRERALQLAAAMGIDDLADRYPKELSGGQLQRVCIARALMAEPPIVLADEPTSSIPIDLAGQVLECITDNTSVLIISTHDPAIYQQMDRTLGVGEWQAHRSS